MPYYRFRGTAADEEFERLGLRPFDRAERQRLEEAAAETARLSAERTRVRNQPQAQHLPDPAEIYARRARAMGQEA